MNIFKIFQHFFRFLHPAKCSQSNSKTAKDIKDSQSRLNYFCREHSASPIHTIQAIQTVSITRFVRCFRKMASIDDSHQFLTIQLLKWTAKMQTDRRLTIKGHNYIGHNKSQELYITTMLIPSKSILLSDVTDCFSKGGMNLCLG